MSHGAELESAKQQNATYKRLFLGLSLLWLASLAAIFGVVMGSVAVTRQTIIPSNSGGVMTLRDGNTVVQTAPFTVSRPASSANDDAFWQGLTYLTLTSTTGSWVQLGVQATARIQGTGTGGSVIKIESSLGTVVLDGEAITFSESMATLFTDAGFSVAPSGRRLLTAATAAGTSSGRVLKLAQSQPYVGPQGSTTG